MFMSLLFADLTFISGELGMAGTDLFGTAAGDGRQDQAIQVQVNMLKLLSW